MLPSSAIRAQCTVTDGIGTFELNDPGFNKKYSYARLITLENPRIRVQIAPDAEGNIVSFTDKTSRRNPFSRLDDNFTSTGQWQPEPFACRIDESGPDRAAITLTAKGKLTPYPANAESDPAATELELVRTMSIDSESSRLRVNVTITNKGTNTAPERGN
jgi:hypothetical protein